MDLATERIPGSGATTPRPAVGRVARAAFVGTVIEFYDFFIFATATILVFGQVFYPSLGGGRGTLALAATFVVALVARPVGAVLFGHLGDRLGRKRTLIYTMSLMGLSTFAIGLIPSYDSIGVLAPALLVALRFGQGIAVGGEWSGAAVIIAEYAPPGQRGRYGTILQLGPIVGFALSSATFLAVFSLTGDPRTDGDFQSWGWRIPFVASILLLGIGLYVRLTIEETPVFAQALDWAVPARLPVRDAVAGRWREILLGAGALAAPFAFFYVGSVFVAGYAGANPKSVPPGVLGLSSRTVLTAMIVAAAAYVIACVLAAPASDRLGRRTVLLAANAVAIPVGLLTFPLMDRGGSIAFGVSLCLLFAVVGLGLGPAAAFVPELFATRYRYTAAGLAYNIAGIFGGVVPIIVTERILDAYDSFSVGVFLAGMAAASIACLLALPETRHVDLTGGAGPAPIPARG